MKILTVIGARPQFIKAAAISRSIKKFNDITEVIVHTGQHYDENMSKVFFDELEIPKPKYNLEVSGGHHGEMTAKMMIGLEEVLLNERPDWVLIYGDTNSTLAGAVVASKLHVPIAHVEAGLRSFNMKMPEEVNRILADRVSTLLFCPTDTAVDNLLGEGVTTGVHNFGDVMYDVALFYGDRAKEHSRIHDQLLIQNDPFYLITCHRAENTDSKDRMFEILSALDAISKTTKVVFPIHPRTKKIITNYGFDDLLKNLIVTEPLAFLDMIALEQSATAILTDSGGVQKEAFFYGVPCITMRDETEWVETVELGMNTLVGASSKKIVNAVASLDAVRKISLSPYGDGFAAQKIVNCLRNYNL